MTEGLWYFAHPCSVPGERREVYEQANFQLQCYRAGELIRRGYIIYAPLAMTIPIQRAHPALAKMEYEEAWKLWIAFDQAIIRHCSFVGIILAPGWEESRGCRAERRLFEELGREVLEYEEACNEPG